MRLRVDRASFAEEVRRFGLHFCCEHCSHFVRAHERCAHGWPERDHRAARYAEDSEFEEVVFCKEFELR